MKCVLLVLCVSATFVTSSASEMDPLSDEYIHFINSRQSSWKAKRIFHKDALLFTQPWKRYHDKEIYDIPSKEYDPEFIKGLPESFDPRDKWPACESLNEIREQGACMSAWALAPASMMTDRYCIAFNGTKKFHFSAENILSCFSKFGFGCRGGLKLGALHHWKLSGYVSGGNYDSNEGCVPYSLKPCDFVNVNATDFCTTLAETPICKTTCQDNYNISYEDDLKFGDYSYSLKGEDNIRAELVTKGPVVTTFSLYLDFEHYSSGVYQHFSNSPVAAQDAKIIGYGVENGTKYWLVANSWTKTWGEKGFFKILRGSDECGIESNAMASDPVL